LWRLFGAYLRVDKISNKTLAGSALKRFGLRDSGKIVLEYVPVRESHVHSR
jgi:hypothetical protein